jgi:nucleotide-binding universal stress UspA family protein
LNEVCTIYQSILVPLDGSAFGEHALPAALSIARRSGANLHLILVHTPFVYAESGLVYDERIDRTIREQEQAYLEGLFERVKAAAPVPVTWVLRDGLTSDSIREQVASIRADLIVMTTHGRGPLSRFWLGSVADSMVREVAVPIFLESVR